MVTMVLLNVACTWATPSGNGAFAYDRPARARPAVVAPAACRSSNQQRPSRLGLEAGAGPSQRLRRPAGVGAALGLFLFLRQPSAF